MSSVCVHGLGYIGLPTAAMLANYDHDVYGYDVDPAITSNLRDGEASFDEPGLRAFVTQALESGQLEIVDDVVSANYHVICVPTPFDDVEKAADLSYVEAAADAVVPVLRKRDTIILESTVPPGTTSTNVRGILEESGLVAGEDFALVYCPETVLPGDIVSELRTNDRIVGGVNGISTESAVRLYESFVEGDIHTTSDPTTAEFVKLVQNTFRDVNIALANEIAKLAAEYDIDSREAIAMANAHPRVDILEPGPGVGGHCLPVDPWFLGETSQELELIATARAVNDGMTGYVIDLLSEELGTLAERRIAILGAAYKGNVGDTRNSPGLRMARELQHGLERSVPAVDGGRIDAPEVVVHDPHVVDPTLDLHDLESATTDSDALVIATDHDEFESLDPEPLGDRMAGRTVIDTKAMLDTERWRRAGFTVRRV